MPRIVDPDERRSSIAAATVELIERVGLERASIREIGRATGHSTGVLSHYFVNQADLLATAYQWMNREAGIRLEKARAGKRGVDGIHAALTTVMPLSAPSRRTWVVRIEFWPRRRVNPDDDLYRTRAWAVLHQLLVQHLGEAVEDGEIGPLDDAAAVADQLIGIAIGMSVAATLNPREFPARRIRAALDSFLRGLRPS